MSSHSSNPPGRTALYPEPTIIVGLGRFGLSVLERLGDDWRWLSTSAAGDTSLKNLRLISLRAHQNVDDHHWRQSESQLAQIAFAAGEDDFPTLALHWAILRSLGLIRFCDGTYQFALPQDAGIVEKGHRHDTRRQRFFQWLSLDSDPVRSVERLYRLAQRDPDVDLFLTPIVERAIHGQSPRLLLHLIARCRALLDGRDPAPWPWLQEALPDAIEADHFDNAPKATIPFHDAWWSEDDRLGLLNGVLPLPDTEALHLPRPFWPLPGDLLTPLSPDRMLRVDWENSGWVAEEIAGRETIEFNPVQSSLFRLGFFDHDPSSGFDANAFADRLHTLGDAVHRGLLRIWLDLQREREENPTDLESQRRRDGSEASTEQCLEILGELIIAPLLEPPHHPSDQNDEHTPSPPRPRARADRWVDGPELSNDPSPTLRDSIVDFESPEAMPERPLLERFKALGLHFGSDELGQRHLFHEISLTPDDLHGDARLTDLRSTINNETRHLVSYEHLKSYRQRPTRQPPRLTVFVVGEAKEAFSRRAFRPVLRALHQELMRAYGPIFDTNREAFDRALSIVPIIWTPHPADAFGGDHPDANRIEEASILEAVHELRRWAEALPPNRRCISQIFVNSRVTDNAVLGLDNAVTQTRDFLTFQIRNDLARDPWLRQAAAGFHSDDLFSTFTCVQIDFPAERAREYLANRLARQALARLHEPGRQEDIAQAEEDLIELTPPPEKLLEPSQRRLKQETSSTAERLATAVDDRCVLDASTRGIHVEARFNDAFENHLHDNVHSAWHTLTRNRGVMDSMVNDLRRASARHLHNTLDNTRTGANQLIKNHAAKGGLKSAQTGFNRLFDHSRSLLDDAESERRLAQDLCLTHRIPDTTPITRHRADVLAAAHQKPDQYPIWVGLLLWAAMAPALGAPLAHSVARAFDLQESIGPLETLLGPFGWLLGGLFFFLPLFFLLRHHMQKRLNTLRDAVSALSDAVRDVVEGSDTGLFHSSPSIRSFFAARLHLTFALAGRGFADQLHDRVDQDRRLGSRLLQSLDVQERRLRQRAEALGVRPSAPGDTSGPVNDDIRAIFDDRRQKGFSLLPPEHLLDHYRRHFRSIEDLDQAIPNILDHAGGFDRWREEACLSDTEALLDFGRHEFLDIVLTPAGAHAAFESEVGKNLALFVARHYANVGFGARFIGFEGFDSDGLRRLAETSLVIHPDLRPAFDKARRSPDAPATTETLEIIDALIQPNTAYILSLVQGIHARSVHNLRRHETFFDRLQLPDPAAPWNQHPITIAGRRRSLPTSTPDPTPEPKPEPEPS